MHEMTIIAGVLEIAHRRAEAAGAARINQVVLEVGCLAGVEPEALRFCFEAARGGISAGAGLEIREVKGRGHCAACDAGLEVDDFVAICPGCGCLLEITCGRELRVLSLNVD